MTKRIAVIGASGFIGKVVTQLLSEKGYSVLEGNSQNADVTNKSKLDKFIKKAEIVVHLAVYQNIFDRCYDKFYLVNVTGTKNVLDIAKKYKQRVILFSSEVVFGKGSDFYTKSKKEQLSIAKKYSDVEIIYPPAVIDLSAKRRWWQLMPGGIMAMIGKGNKIINFIEVTDLGLFVIDVIENKKKVDLPVNKLTKDEFVNYVGKMIGGFRLPFRIPIWFIRFIKVILGRTKYGKMLEMMIENEK